MHALSLVPLRAWAAKHEKCVGVYCIGVHRLSYKLDGERGVGVESELLGGRV